AGPGGAGRGRAGRAAGPAQQLRPVHRPAADQQGRAGRAAAGHRRRCRPAHRRGPGHRAGRAVRLRQPRRGGRAGGVPVRPGDRHAAAADLRTARGVPATQLLPGQLQPGAGRGRHRADRTDPGRHRGGRRPRLPAGDRPGRGGLPGRVRRRRRARRRLRGGARLRLGVLRRGAGAGRHRGGPADPDDGRPRDRPVRRPPRGAGPM
ncbi:MAG: TOMM biosynthesis dehydrogenase (protein B), partial [uncultured Corynebacteriales bacterium]